MDTNVLIDEYLTCLLVRVYVRNTQKQSKVLSKVLQKLSLSVQAQRPASFD